MGVSLLIFLGDLNEYLIPASEFDQIACQASYFGLSLPFPDLNPCISCDDLGVSLTDSLPFAGYA